MEQADLIIEVMQL